MNSNTELKEDLDEDSSGEFEKYTMNSNTDQAEVTVHEVVEGSVHEIVGEEAAPIPSPIASFADEIDAIPVKFAVSLPAMELPMAQVQRLSEGHSVEMDLDLTEDVNISVNNKILGQGKLVQIGDRIGVQIKRWIN